MENYQNQNQPETTASSESIFEDHDQYIDATQGQRFLNFVIDLLLMNFVLSRATGYIFGYIMAYVAPDFIRSIIEEGDTGWRYWLLSYLLSYFNFLIYYTFAEKIFKGITLGKLITGTRAIRNDGGELSFRDAILRSLSRIVPFEAFSALGRKPWHDSWTNTRVIKTR